MDLMSRFAALHRLSEQQREELVKLLSEMDADLVDSEGRLVFTKMQESHQVVIVSTPVSPISFDKIIWDELPRHILYFDEPWKTKHNRNSGVRAAKRGKGKRK